VEAKAEREEATSWEQNWRSAGPAHDSVLPRKLKKLEWVCESGRQRQHSDKILPESGKIIHAYCHELELHLFMRTSRARIPSFEFRQYSAATKMSTKWHMEFVS
jgi:hypothetical protein